MANKTETFVFIVALTCAVAAVAAVGGGLLTSVLVGAGVAAAVAVVGTLLFSAPTD